MISNLNKKGNYSIKTIWTKICLLHLRKKEHIYLNKFEIEPTNDNLQVLYTFLHNISSMCQDIYNSCVPTDNIKLHNQIEALLLDTIINIPHVELDRFTSKYCECLLLWCEYPKQWSHLEPLFNQVKAALLKSPVTIEKVFVTVLTPVVNDYLNGIADDYENEYNVPVLDKMLAKAKDIVEDRVLPLLFPRTINNESFLPNNFVYKLYFNIHLPKIFEIIMEYPNSIVVLKEISRCVLQLDVGAELCDKLTKLIKERLLNPAVDTSSIITAYILIIKSLRIIDPMYFLEEIVSVDIRKTLFNREDTISAVIDKILNIDDEKEHDLAEKKSVKVLIQNELSEFGDVKCTLDDMYNWTPDPIGSLGVRGLWYKPLDIIGLLLNIYNNRDLFPSEYKNLLSKRLIKNTNLDMEKELRNLESLKLRLGSAGFEDCDVMLNDICESKSITKNIKKKIIDSSDEIDFNVQPFIISANFWPMMNDNEFKLPENLTVPFDIYSKHYGDYKINRELKWCHTLGSVELELELHNKKMILNVTPLQAAVVYYFSEKPRWELIELSKVLMLNVPKIRSAVNFWIQKEFLRDVNEVGIPETYEIVDVNDSESCDNRKKMIYNDFDEDFEDEIDDVGDKEAELYENLWEIVSFMLKLASNQKKQMDFDNIFTTIPIYPSDVPINITKEQLRAFLDSKLSDGLITVTENNYYLNKAK